MEIIPVKTQAEIDLTAQLAKAIWGEHYLPIIGQEQVDYMIANFQSPAAIGQQIKEGYEYYLIKYQGLEAGYFAIQPRAQQGHLFLSKLYVYKDYRGLGLAKASLKFIENRARALAYERIYLTVNKNNQLAISSYLKMGFAKIKAFQQDIGNGFVMDDYGMEKVL